MNDQPTDTGKIKVSHCIKTRCPALDTTDETCTQKPIAGKGLKYAKVENLDKCPWIERPR